MVIFPVTPDVWEVITSYLMFTFSSFFLLKGLQWFFLKSLHVKGEIVCFVIFLIWWNILIYIWIWKHYLSGMYPAGSLYSVTFKMTGYSYYIIKIFVSMEINLSGTFFQMYSQLLVALLADQVSWLVWDFLSFKWKPLPEMSKGVGGGCRRS